MPIKTIGKFLIHSSLMHFLKTLIYTLDCSIPLGINISLLLTKARADLTSNFRGSRFSDAGIGLYVK